MFPSADMGAGSSGHLQRQRGKRRKSGTRRIDNGWSQSSQDALVFSNQGAAVDHHDSIPVRDTPPFELQGSPRQQGKYLRQQAREKELAKQKELARQKDLLMRKLAEEERRRILQQEQRAAMIAKDYGSTRYREVDIDQHLQRSQSGRVMKEAMKFEAHLQIMQEKGVGSQSPSMNHDRMLSHERHIKSPERQSNYGRVVNSYDQFTTI